MNIGFSLKYPGFLVIVGIVFLVVFSSCGEKTEDELSANELITNPNSADPNADADKPFAVIKFEQTSYDFGFVEAGNKVERIFKFTNSGEAPLLISGASASCGCTVPSYPKKPVQPGESDEIRVVFDTKGKAGNQMKVVTITANTNPSHTEISLKGQVTINETEQKSN